MAKTIIYPPNLERLLKKHKAKSLFTKSRAMCKWHKLISDKKEAEYQEALKNDNAGDALFYAFRFTDSESLFNLPKNFWINICWA